jgi:hypothetical protein
MKFIIDPELIEKYDLTLEECILLIFLARGGKIQPTIQSLKRKMWMEDVEGHPGDFRISRANMETLTNIITDSADSRQFKEEFYTKVANKLRELYPKGNKPGTLYNWRGSTAEIARKLKNLVVKYNCRFTEEEAITATKSYVSSFNGDYKYMKLLKYFLLKTPTNNNGDVEIESEFMTYLENPEAGDFQNNNWTTDLA